MAKTKITQASYFVSQCLKLLPKPLIVISYADTGQNHHGYIYQATNWIYTGLSSKFNDPQVEGLEHQHHATYAHGLNKEQLLKKYGDRLYYTLRKRKHRYIYFLGNRTQKTEMVKSLNYAQQPYPKGNNKRYDASYKPKVQGKLF